MKLELFLDLSFLFICYSFLGYVAEVLFASIIDKKDINRGILNGPLCMSYGVLSIILFVTLKYTNNVFLGIALSTVYGVAVSYITAKILLKISNRLWWDFSNKKFNFEGIIAWDYSILLGILGYLLTKFVSPFLVFLFHDFDMFTRGLFILLVDILLAIDFIISVYSLIKKRDNKKIKDYIGENISSLVIERINNAYPNFKKRVFNAELLSFDKVFLIFYITGVIGCIIEVFFCRYSMGRWMHRSSLIFEEISMVWGGAFVLCTVFLHKHRKANWLFILVFGTFVGAFFEYLCSAFTEFFLGTVFWSYSKHAFNLNTRINLLYSLFWGICSLLYIKGLYPVINKAIDKIPEKIGKICVRVLFFIFIVDLVISTTVGMRYQARRHGEPPRNFIEEKYDKYFPDEFMKSRFSNTIVRD